MFCWCSFSACSHKQITDSRREKHILPAKATHPCKLKHPLMSAGRRPASMNNMQGTLAHLWASLLLRHELVEMAQIWLLWLLLQASKVLGEVLGHGHGAWQLHRCLSWQTGPGPENVTHLSNAIPIGCFKNALQVHVATALGTEQLCSRNVSENQSPAINTT